MAYYKVLPSVNGQYYAVLFSSNNNEPICWTETYVSEQNAKKAIAWIKANAKDAPVKN